MDGLESDVFNWIDNQKVIGLLQEFERNGLVRGSFTDEVYNLRPPIHLDNGEINYLSELGLLARIYKPQDGEVPLLQATLIVPKKGTSNPEPEDMPLNELLEIIGNALSGKTNVYPYISQDKNSRLVSFVGTAPAELVGIAQKVGEAFAGNNLKNSIS